MTRARVLADYVAGGSTAAEFDVLDGLTSTTAELNILDGVTSTTAELNHVDGVTSNVQTQMNAKAPLASPDFTGTVDSAGPITFAGSGPSAQSQGALAYTSGSGQVTMLAYGPDSSTKGFFQFQTLKSNGDTATNDLTIQADGDVKVGSGDLVFGTAGKGINLGVTANTDANTLDDYEEGTFTPALSSGTRVGSSFIGTYTKIGRMVHIVIILGDINASSASAYSASSNQYISGLPFTSVTHTGASGGLSTSYSIRLGGVGENILEWRVNSNNTTCTGHWFDTTGVGSNTIQSQWTTGGCGTYLTGSYLTA